jgi:hypothetical protein
VDADPFLRRLQWTAVIACLGMATIAFVISGGRADPAVAVLGGGLLVGVSYRTIESGVTALAKSADSRSQPYQTTKPAPRVSWIAAKVVARYALLALLAYVMIARLRLHPVGLLAGASSVVAAASIEVLRLLLKKS